MSTLNEELKKLIGDLFTTDLETKLGVAGKSVVYLWNKEDEKEKDKEPIPKFRVNEMLETSKAKAESLAAQITTFETQAKDYDKQLKDLKKAAEGNTELVKQIEELQNNNKKQKEDFELEKTTLAKKDLERQKHSALMEGLLDAQVYLPEHRNLLAMEIESAIGLDKIELDEKSKVKNLADILKSRKENKAYESFFGKTVPKGQEHIQGELVNGELFSREQLNSLTKEQMLDPKIMEKVDKSYAALKN